MGVLLLAASPAHAQGTGLLDVQRPAENRLEDTRPPLPEFAPAEPPQTLEPPPVPPPAPEP
jgi:hypothetical protein